MYSNFPISQSMVEDLVAKKVKAMRLSEFRLSHLGENEFSLVSLNVMADVGFGFGHRMQMYP